MTPADHLDQILDNVFDNGAGHIDFSALTELDLNDNCFSTKVSKKLKKWLDELNPGWDDTQTGYLY
jgi:hypothetical protein